MEPVVGIFPDREAAGAAARSLRARGWPQNRIHLLPPDAPASKVETVPVDDAEQPGIGRALGAVLGAGIGATAGMGLGAVLGSSALGLTAAGVFGAAGGLGGSALAGEFETRAQSGLPHDELYVYEDALANGRSVVVALARSSHEADSVREAFDAAGAEALDAARESWWIGLRDAEKAHYEATADDWDSAEPLYRQGFEAAQDPIVSDRRFEDSLPFLRAVHGAAADSVAFRLGFERGQAHRPISPAGGTAPRG